MSAFKSPATAISIAALVVACSGGAFAAGHAIDGRSIQNGTVSLSKLAPSLRAEIRAAPKLQIVDTTSSERVTLCPRGYQSIGGGFIYSGTYSSPSPTVIQSTPFGSNQGWESAQFGGDGSSQPVAVCARIVR